ncbi:OmpA family protein [Algicella marina]|uniref:OmpA family protein n=2 Tax=Algicella marina TaxID=2683284 RepID=A0A6P1T6M7_9RHOB|nr:OmpA family protein [Algicella marina]
MKTVLLAVALVASTALPAFSQEDGEGIKIYFDLGSASVPAPEQAKLDAAARLFREGNPFVMIVSGAADKTGDPGVNLDLSLARANKVADALVARGIPVERLQVLGRGTSEPEVETAEGVAEERNRLVEINWR